MGTLADRTLFVTGGSRGIGLTIAKRAARDGAKLVLVGKTEEPHADLPGSLPEAAEEVREAGGEAIYVAADG